MSASVILFFHCGLKNIFFCRRHENVHVRTKSISSLIAKYLLKLQTFPKSHDFVQVSSKDQLEEDALNRKTVSLSQVFWRFNSCFRRDLVYHFMLQTYFNENFKAGNFSATLGSIICDLMLVGKHCQVSILTKSYKVEAEILLNSVQSMKYSVPFWHSNVHLHFLQSFRLRGKNWFHTLTQTCLIL